MNLNLIIRYFLTSNFFNFLDSLKNFFTLTRILLLYPAFLFNKMEKKILKISLSGFHKLWQVNWLFIGYIISSFYFEIFPAEFFIGDLVFSKNLNLISLKILFSVFIHYLYIFNFILNDHYILIHFNPQNILWYSFKSFWTTKTNFKILVFS